MVHGAPVPQLAWSCECCAARSSSASRSPPPRVRSRSSTTTTTTATSTTPVRTTRSVQRLSGALRRASRRSPRRRLNATDPNAGWSALRIHVIDAVTGAGVLDAASEAFLLGTLGPPAVGWLEAALLVEPVVGTLRRRACGAPWSNGVCTLEATTACGHAAAVPAELLDELTVYDHGGVVHGGGGGRRRRRRLCDLDHRARYDALLERRDDRLRVDVPARQTTGPSSATPTSARRSSRPRPPTGTSSARRRCTSSSTPSASRPTRGRSSDATTARPTSLATPTATWSRHYTCPGAVGTVADVRVPCGGARGERVNGVNVGWPATPRVTSVARDIFDARRWWADRRTSRRLRAPASALTGSSDSSHD